MMTLATNSSPKRLMAQGVTPKNGTALPTIDLAEGELCLALGPSGCGKTSALMALGGIERPTAGSVMIGDVDLWALSDSRRDRLRGRQIGMIFQSFHLIDALSVRGNLEVAAKCAGLALDANHVGRLIGLLGLADFVDRRADRLSQGQMQRVGIARALVNRPAVVLADEPTSALDDDNARIVAHLLTDIRRHFGTAMVIATHDRRLCDTVEAQMSIRMGGAS